MAIVLATYNGEQFIQQQIESIQAQSFTGWRLYIRDDGSRDATLAVVHKMAANDSRIILVADELGNLGAIGNFGALMALALAENADYLFFADQDDVWHPRKMAEMLSVLSAMEDRHGKIPLLAHCDLAVVDAALKPIADSFVAYSRLSPTQAKLGTILCQNQVTGCACVINRALLALACPVPPGVRMHDWWLALIAAAVGKIGFLPTPLVAYRQHDGNVLGAVSLSRRIAQLLTSSRQRRLRTAVMHQSMTQAALLAQRLKSRDMAPPQVVLAQIETYATILELPSWRRAFALCHRHIKRTSSITTMLLLLRITIMSKQQRLMRSNP